MSMVTIEKIISVSSEDAEFPAENLLSPEKGKWLTMGKRGEVIVKLKKPSLIKSIEISNSASAYVSVAVSEIGNKIFKDLQSRNNVNDNRIRYFTKKDLVKKTASLKCQWDMVRIVVTQPYNEKIRHGLNYIKFYEADNCEMNEEDEPNEKPSSSTESTEANNTKRATLATVSSTPAKRARTAIVKAYKPFHQLLEGVVICISGLQHPERKNIRQQAVAMGAAYTPDWQPSSPHWICAFENTPKYNQVKGHGKIVTQHWITECYTKKIRLPCKRFLLDNDNAATSDSDIEIYDETLRPSYTSSDSYCDSEDAATSDNDIEIYTSGDFD